jgi:hypothetical protein
MLPILLLLAGAAFTAPVALTASGDYELAKNPETLKAYVREYFTDIPVMADIAWCESRFRHLGTDGDIFRGKVNNSDIGVMQINTAYHAEGAEKLNIDLYSLEGNLAYAKYLYEKEGTKPWNSSRPCWGKLVVAK